MLPSSEESHPWGTSDEKLPADRDGRLDHRGDRRRGGMAFGQSRLRQVHNRIAPERNDVSSASGAGLAARLPEFSDPRVPLFGDNYIEDSGYDLAFRYSLPIADRGSLPQCCESAEGRSRRGLAEVLGLLDQLTKVYPRPDDYDQRHAMLQTFVGLLFMYDGRFNEASPWLEKARIENPDLAREVRANLLALRGVAALRLGELENCVACLGPSSCIFPIASEAVHQRTEGSREAIRCFTDYLKERPGTSVCAGC